MRIDFKNELGRSMIEMLGVLAIIGVLSVAGIAGYTMAMRAYRANEMVHAASIFFAAARSNNGGNGTLATNYNANFGYPTGTTLPGNAQAINYVCVSDGHDGCSSKYVTLQAHDNADCKAVENKIGTVSTQPMYVDSTHTCGEGDTLRVMFNEN